MSLDRERALSEENARIQSESQQELSNHDECREQIGQLRAELTQAQSTFADERAQLVSVSSLIFNSGHLLSRPLCFDLGEREQRHPS